MTFGDKLNHLKKMCKNILLDYDLVRNIFDSARQSMIDESECITFNKSKDRGEIKINTIKRESVTIDNQAIIFKDKSKMFVIFRRDELARFLGVCGFLISQGFI